MFVTDEGELRLTRFIVQSSTPDVSDITPRRDHLA